MHSGHLVFVASIVWAAHVGAQQPAGVPPTQDDTAKVPSAPAAADARAPSQGDPYNRSVNPNRELGRRIGRGFERPSSESPTDIKIQGGGLTTPNCFSESREGTGCGK